MLYPVEHHKSFIWTDRYDTPGDFEIYIPIAAVSREHLKIDNYISCDMSEHLMIIEDIKTESDLDNGNFLIVTGKSLESIPSRRIVWYPITFTDEPLQNVIKTLLEKNIISPEDTSRAIPNFIFEESTDERITSIDKVTVSYAIGDNLGDIIEDICKTYQLGYKIIPNDDNQFIFSLFAGTDRSYAQETNPWIIFSPNQDNIISSRFNESTSNYKNVTLVINEKTTYDEANPEGVTERSGLVLGSTAGLSRRETFTDASGIDTDEETTQHDLLANMRVEGYKTLAEYKYDKDFDGEIDYIRSYQYGTDFYIGDIVEIQDLFGNEGRERVTEYMIKEDTNGFAAYPTLTSVVEDTAGGGYSYELKLGTEHENAFYGDWGYEAYNHAHTTGNPHNTTWSDVGADELGAADKAYERAKSDAQTIGNSALRNANTYTNNQIKKLKDLTAKDWQPGIDSAVLAGVTEAKTYTDAKSAENEVYTDQEVEKAKNELTDYTDSKSSDDRKYADSLIKDLVGQAPEELNTIYELAQAIRNTSVTDALTSRITSLESRRTYYGDVSSGKNGWDLVTFLGLDPNTPVPIADILKKISEKSRGAAIWVIGNNSQPPNAYTNSLFESGNAGILFMYSDSNTKTSRWFLTYVLLTSGNKYTNVYRDGTFNTWRLFTGGSTLFNRYPFIDSNGVMEVGRYLDFHYTSGETNDNSARLEVSGQGLVSSVNFVARYGSTVWQENGARQNGYVRLLTITIKDIYMNMPIVIELARRAAQTTCTLYIVYANVKSTDPELGTFVYEGTDYNARLVKTGSGIWDLYAYRSESSDHINIVRLHKPQFMNGVTITYKGNATGTDDPGGTHATFGGQAATEINSLKNSVSNGKTLVANAITKKGVSTATTADFATMAENIGKIQGSSLMLLQSVDISTKFTGLSSDVLFKNTSSEKMFILIELKVTCKEGNHIEYLRTESESLTLNNKYFTIDGVDAKAEITSAWGQFVNVNEQIKIIIQSYKRLYTGTITGTIKKINL